MKINHKYQQEENTIKRHKIQPSFTTIQAKLKQTKDQPEHLDDNKLLEPQDVETRTQNNQNQTDPTKGSDHLESTNLLFQQYLHYY